MSESDEDVNASQPSSSNTKFNIKFVVLIVLIIMLPIAWVTYTVGVLIPQRLNASTQQLLQTLKAAKDSGGLTTKP